MKISYVTNCVTVSAKLLRQFISMNKTVSPKARTNPLYHKLQQFILIMILLIHLVHDVKYLYIIVTPNTPL